jgi:PadR family transcriptional regulator, regulatory protein AphA
VSSRPTATSFALLGLIGIQPWTASELVEQSKRSLHWFWPRSEAHLYAELKRLVERGHAEAESVEGRRRQRTRYTITPEGRTALENWLESEPVPATLEVEGFLRMMLGDQGTKDDVLAALESTARHAREAHADGRSIIEGLLETGGPFPQRMHLVVPLASFYDEFLRLLIRWCDETSAEIEQWPGTRDIGLTPEVLQRFQRIAARPEP